jgi:4'-phosphopantetheinyl transferase
MRRPVHLWWASPSDARPGDGLVLDDVERSRAAAYVHAVDRNRFVVGAALVRCALAGHTGLAPDRVRVDRTCDRCGKPHGRVRTPDAPVSVSVSHAGEAVLVATATGVAIGVDVEPVEIGPDLRSVALATLTAGELGSMAGLSDSSFGHRFLQHWVAKEAILKASGHGLRLPMAGIDLAGDQPPFRVRRWTGQPGVAGPIELHCLTLTPAGHEACLAVLGETTGVAVEERPGVELLASLGLR